MLAVPRNSGNCCNEIDHPDPIKEQQRKTNIQQLFQSWNESGDEQEQQETLEIILESL